MFDRANVSLELGVSSPSLNSAYISDLASELGSTSKPNVVLLTSTYDSDSDILQVHLNAEGYTSIRLNCESFPQEQVSHSYAQGSLFTTSRDKKGGLFLLDPKVVIYRHFQYVCPTDSQMTGEDLFEISQIRQVAANFEDYFVDAQWINHPRAVARCRNRILQLQKAHSFGLITPNTLITNDRLEAASFIRDNGPVIAKAVDHHGVRTGNILHNFYGALISEPSDVDLELKHPVLFQEYLPKIAEIRVYVIAGKLICVRIQAKDGVLPIDMHTRPLQSYEYSLCELPSEIAVGCRHLVNALGLTYAAIDLVQIDRQSLVFLEINPAGDWAWIDSQVSSGLTATFAKVIASYLG